MEDKVILHQHKKDIIKISNFINEIRAHDIYTIRNTEVYNSLPGVSTFYGGADSPPYLDCDPYFNKSNWRCRSIMKKLSFQNMKKPFINLPALMEEENSMPTAAAAGSQMLPVAGKFSASNNNQNVCISSEGNNDSEFENESVCSGDVDQYDDGSSLEVLDDDDDDESWVDLSKHTQPASSTFPARAFSAESSSSSMSRTQPPKSPERTTPPPFGNGEEYLRLLREAQKESNQSSAKVSLASSRRDTPRDSPKSPPNSPNTEVVLESEEPPMIKGVYINYYNRDGDFVRVEKNVETDWIWDWSSRPDQTPPKEWKFVHPGKAARRGASIRRLMVGNSPLFSRDVLYTLLITNVLSLLLGTGIGIWLSRRSGGGGSGGTLPIAMIPIN